MFRLCQVSTELARITEFANGNSTYFFQQVGLNGPQAYSLGLGANALALVACFVNWFLLMP